MKRTYTIIIDGEEGNYSALAPDGIAVGLGDTLDEVRRSVRHGLVAVIDSYVADGKPIPATVTTVDQARHEHPGAIVETVDIDVPDEVASPMAPAHPRS